MRNRTITQASETHTAAPRFDPSAPVMVEEERHLSAVRRVSPDARLLTDGATGRLVVASTAAAARAAAEAGIPMLLDATGDDELRFLADRGVGVSPSGMRRPCASG